MREVDFLPSWYPALFRMKRTTIVGTWVAVTIVLIVAGYALVKRWEVSRVEAAAANCVREIKKSKEELAKLDELLKFQRQLQQQEQIIAQLGIGAEPTRLLNALEDAMPTEMSLTGMTLEVSETPRVGAQQRGRGEGIPSNLPPLRRLNIHLQGVAPTDLDVATLLGHLSAVKVFDNVGLSVSRDRLMNNHSMREFEITFSMELNASDLGSVNTPVTASVN